MHFKECSSYQCTLSLNSLVCIALLEFISSISFHTYSKEWAEFILANRNNKSDISIHDYDIVYGPIANDKVGVQIRKYKDGSINFDEFLHRLQYMKGITFQYFFGTEKAINKLRKL